MKFSRTRFLPFDFQIVHVTHSLAAAAIKCQYLTPQISWNLGAHDTVQAWSLTRTVNFVTVTSSRTRRPVTVGGSGGLDSKVGWNTALLLLLNDNWRHSYLIVLLTDSTLLGALVVLWHLRRLNLNFLA